MPRATPYRPQPLKELIGGFPFAEGPSWTQAPVTSIAIRQISERGCHCGVRHAIEQFA